mgnify:CR=1 FL=1
MNGERPVKISEITAIIKEILEGSFPSVLLEGEISNYRPSSTGHLYFTLKDDSSSISAVMFKGRSRQLAFVPRDGMLVRAKGSISVYEARGTYQIIIDSMEQAGTGDILRLLEERKQRLAREGLFDEKRKRPIPFFPERIAVITSPTGAAVRDIVQILRRRNPAIHIVILPASVQGSEAPESLARQIETANRFAMADLIIIGRGGGSLEDLLPFSDESVVRSIASSKIPVISAVGHETDWSLSDLAADVRAPTPSAAAELASPLAEDILDTIRTSISLLEQSIRGKTEKIRLMMGAFTAESLEMRFRRIAQPRLLRFDDAKEGLLEGMKKQLDTARRRLEMASAGLEGASPRAILKRGYSMVRNAESGAIIRSASEAAPGTLVEIIPGEGIIFARVEEKHDEEI